MEKGTKAEVIAALVTDKFSGFKDGDEQILEACSDARLEEFRASSEANKAQATALNRLEGENRNTTARLRVAEDKLKASEQELDEDEFLRRAPASIKSLVENHKAAEAEEKSTLVGLLKDCGGESEEVLNKKTIVELRTLAKYARVDVPNFSGRGLPVERTAEEKKSYAPPKPYTQALKAAAAPKVN